MRFGRALPLALAALLLAPTDPAAGHAERPSKFPEPPGRVPTYRTEGPTLLVCHGQRTLRRIHARLDGGAEERNLRLFRACQEDGFSSIQAAVNHVERQGTRILILPGIYRETAFAGEPQGECAELAGDPILSYAQHRRCPHVQNLIAIMGDSADRDRICDLPLCRLQVEGTGARPTDVIVDNEFHKLNAIRADRADGVYFRNFTVQHAEFNSVYVIETDGFAIDRMLARWNDEYGFLTFASDHGVYQRCEAYGNGDSGLYPGSAADLGHRRPSIEIHHCTSHHNTLGYSGTAGNSTFVHHNRFFRNGTGVVMDSFFPDHPGLPQDSATFRHNRIYANNVDYYKYWADGTCQDIEGARERFEEGVVCPAIPAPIGVGILVAGGNANWFRRNWIWNNWRYGAMQFWVPASFREEDDPAKQYDTSHFNEYRRNWMGISPGGRTLVNGIDFWWDVEGEGNCWQGNQPAPGEEITSDPPILPDCASGGSPPGPFSTVFQFTSCATWSRENHHPPGCNWMEKPDRPDS
jgi:Right handed beta helix region